MSTGRVVLSSFCGLLALNAVPQRLGASVEGLHGIHQAAYHDAETAERVRLDLVDYSTEGGEAVGYFRETGELILVDVRLFGEMGRSEFSIVWHELGSFIALERRFAYNRPFYLDQEAAMQIGDTEAFDPGKTVIVERFARFDKGRNVYTEHPPAVDIDQFTSSADLVAMADTLQSLLMAAYAASNDRSEGDESVRVELVQPTRPVAIDTAIAGVVMEDATSAVRMLGRATERRLVESDRHQMPHASYSDPDRTAFATFSLHYGAGTTSMRKWN